MFLIFKKRVKKVKEGLILLPYTTLNVEYEILSFIDDQFRIVSKDQAPIEFKKKLSDFESNNIPYKGKFLLDHITNGYEYLAYIKTPEIYSIRRLSDNQVYSLHDRIRFSNGYGPLIRFIVNGSSLYICTGMSGTHQLHEIKRNLVETIITE